jgi:hypothetical protein
MEKNMKKRLGALVVLGILVSIVLVPVNVSATDDVDWLVEGGTSYPTSIDQNIYTDGKVGIGVGTSTISAGLDVQTGITASSGSAKGVNFEQTLTASANDDALTALYIKPSFSDGSYTGVKHYGLILEDGLVGIGDTSPDFKLEVTGSSGSGYFGVTSSSDGDIFIIDTNGDAGIGTATPDVKFDVELSGEPGTVGGAATIGEDTNSATGDYAIAMGSATTASGYYSTAMGAHTTASGPSSVAMGTWSVASGGNSVATGASTDVSGFASLAFGGFDTEVTGDYSCAIGTYLTAGPADDTYVIGRGQDDSNHLVNNIQKSLMVGFDSTTPTLFVDGSSVGIGGTNYFRWRRKQWTYKPNARWQCRHRGN